MRLFVAIDLKPEIKEKIAKIIEKLKITNADVKWVEPENLHITLKFLGEVDDNRIAEIREIIKHCLYGKNIFDIEFDGIGFFGSERYLRVIWIGLGKGKEKIIELMDILNKNLNQIRHEKLKSEAHLTIGRIRSGKNKQALLDAIKELSTFTIGKQSVTEIKLKQSQLSRQGPVYKDIEVFKLE
jgi:2'-5' RNA ligase